MKTTTFWILVLSGVSLVCVFLSITILPREDATILYLYSKNLAETGTISYISGGLPTEGATDFLWMVLISVIYKLGVDPFTTALFLTVLTWILTARLLSHSSQSFLFWMLVLFVTPFFWSGLNGFSTIFFGFIYLLLLSAYSQGNSRLVYFMALILSLVRPDGVILSLPVVAVILFKSKEDLKNKIISLCLIVIIPGLTYFLWRYNYFGHLFPLSFYVKSNFDRVFYVFNTAALRDNLIVIMAVFPFGYLAVKKMLLKYEKYEFYSWFLILLIPVIFYSSMSLDQNIGMRFQYPLFISVIFLYTRYAVTEKPRFVFVIFMIGLFMKPLLYTVSYILDAKNENVMVIAKEMSLLVKGEMIVTEAGKLPYYSGWNAIDSWGLNTPEYAHKVISIADVIKINPDLIVIHAKDHDYSFIEDPTLSSKNTKTWQNQTINLFLATNNNNYEIIMIPYWKKESLLKRILRPAIAAMNRIVRVEPFRPIYVRYDAYVLRKDYPDHKKLIAILKENNGLSFSEYKQMLELYKPIMLSKWANAFL